MLQPFCMLQKPINSDTQPFFKRHRWPITQFLIDLGGIYSIAQVMSRTVFDKGNQLLGRTYRPTQLLIHLPTQFPDQVNVLPFVKTTYIVTVSIFAPMKDQVDSLGMIDHKKPVPRIFAISIDGQWPIVQYIVYTERDQFFGKMIGPIVV